MDQCRSRLKLSENFERHWSTLISGEIHIDQSLVHTFSWGNSYGPMVLKVFLKFLPTLALVHGWLLPDTREVQTLVAECFTDFLLRSPRPATGASRTLRARSVPGVSLEVSLRPFGPRDSCSRPGGSQDFLIFSQQEDSLCPSTPWLGNQRRMLHSFTPFTRIRSLKSRKYGPRRFKHTFPVTAGQGRGWGRGRDGMGWMRLWRGEGTVSKGHGGWERQGGIGQEVKHQRWHQEAQARVNHCRLLLSS